MAKRSESIYNSTLNLKGDATITLSAEERMMICEALSKCAPKEVDILPLAMLVDRMVKGE